MTAIVVGTLESSDCMITLSASDTLKIDLESIVYDAFHAQITQVIKKTLQKEGLHNVRVLCQDKGALDYTIEARMKTAIAKYREANEDES